MMWALRHFVYRLGLCVVLGAGAIAAQAAPDTQFVDGIAAVVNQQVITRHQLDARMAQVRRQMKLQNVPVPKAEVLQRQVLQQMINDALQDQEAKRVGLRISDGQVQQAVNSVAGRNRISVEQLKQEIQRSGMKWDDYLAEIRIQLRDDMLRQRFVEDQIHISDSDIQAFLTSHQDMPIRAPQREPEPQPAPEPPPMPKPKGPELFEVAQIVVEVPDYATNDVVEKKRAEAQALLKKLKGGANFAGIAAASSDGAQALEGGNMGVRPLKDWPDLFAGAIKGLPPGGLSGVLQSGRGFHILKVLQRGYQQDPAQVKAAQKAAAAAKKAAEKAQAEAKKRAEAAASPIVTQTHARHILIKTSQIMSDDKAQKLLEDLRARAEKGESFAELAKRYSEDASAPQGGDLGWLNPTETVPSFEKAMDKLQPGEISAPVKSPFGWHLIQVEDRREKDMEKELRRGQARQELMQRRIGPAYEDWIDKLRAEAYIDNRLEKASRQTDN